MPTAAARFSGGNSGSSSAERGRQQHRRAGRLHDARGDERRRPTARRRRAPEAAVKSEQAAEEDALAPDAVGHAAGRDEQRGEDDRVGVQHPGERGSAEAAKSRAMSGKAMLTMKRSRLAMKTPTETTARTFQRCSCQLPIECDLQFERHRSRFELQHATSMARLGACRNALRRPELLDRPHARVRRRALDAAGAARRLPRPPPLRRVPAQARRRPQRARRPPRALVEEGILERRRYSERPERFEYRLTAKGRDL